MKSISLIHTCIHLCINYRDIVIFVIQLNGDNTFEDVCPLLDNINYTQHVRVATDLQLNTINLPDVVRRIHKMLTQLFIFILCCQFNDSYSYNCLIGDVEVDAVRNDETSLTCQILQDDVCQHMYMLIEILILLLLLLYNIPAYLYHKFTSCRNQYCLDWPIRFETYY